MITKALRTVRTNNPYFRPLANYCHASGVLSPTSDRHLTMYRQLSALPLPTSAQFTATSSLKLSFIVRDHIRNVKRVVNKTVTPATDYEDAPVDVVSSLTSPSKSLRAILRDTTKSGGSRRFVEIWSDDRLVACKDVTSIHGHFYSDEFISSLVFSPSETSLLYIAEQNSPSSSPKAKDPFAEFRYTPSFGEGLSSSKRPAIFVLSGFESGIDLRIYQLVPTLNQTIHFGHVVFHTDTELYATGHELTSEGRLLGIKYCTNRALGIWRISFATLPLTTTDTSESATTIDCKAEKLTPSDLSCRSPRIFASSTGLKLTYLSCELGGPHMSTNSLHLIDLPASSDSSPAHPTTLVPIVHEPVSNSFPGLYPPYSLATSFLVKHTSWNTPKIVTHSTWGSRNTIILIDTQTGEITNLTPIDKFNWNWTVLTTDGTDRIVCVRSSPSVPHQVLLGTVSDTLSVEWKIVHEPTLTEDLKSALSSLETKIIPVPDRQPVETIVIKASNQDGKVVPCILTPHGGPHSTSTTEFNPLSAAFALDGYTLALPNYTGSPGFGHTSVKRLIGECGSLDVGDCISSLHHLARLGYVKLGRGNVFIHGGSHGGFLGAHLIGQYPDVFTAAVLRNPVISAGEISTSDLTDWYYAEFGLPYPASMSSNDDNSDHGESAVVQLGMTPETYERLYNASPIRHADKVTADVLLLVGRDDLRVAPTQGYTYYHTLKALRHGGGGGGGGGRVEMLVFDGESHGLEGVECGRVGWEAARAFFAQAAAAAAAAAGGEKS